MQYNILSNQNHEYEISILALRFIENLAKMIFINFIRFINLIDFMTNDLRPVDER